MERDLPNPSPETLEELRRQAAEAFGEDALFTYIGKDNAASTLTFAGALDICGQHIGRLPFDDILVMLREMQERAVRLQHYDEQTDDTRFAQSLERGRAIHERMSGALAKRALDNNEV